MEVVELLDMNGVHHNIVWNFKFLFCIETNTYCPDDTSQRLVSDNIVKIGGDFDGYYPIGPINKLVYPVKGGAEDWAYGASWDKKYTQCENIILLLLYIYNLNWENDFLFILFFYYLFSLSFPHNL